MESNHRKFTYLTFLCLAGLAALIGFKFGETILVLLKIPTQIRAFGDQSTMVFNHASVAGILSGVVGLVTFFVLSFNATAVAYTDDCISELTKMTWPTQKETTASTIVVTIMILIAALIFFLIDTIWTNFFHWLL